MSPVMRRWVIVGAVAIIAAAVLIDAAIGFRGGSLILGPLFALAAFKNFVSAREARAYFSQSSPTGGRGGNPPVSLSGQVRRAVWGV
jgi:hypothetical protein